MEQAVDVDYWAVTATIDKKTRCPRLQVHHGRLARKEKQTQRHRLLEIAEALRGGTARKQLRERISLYFPVARAVSRSVR